MKTQLYIRATLFLGICIYGWMLSGCSDNTAYQACIARADQAAKADWIKSNYRLRWEAIQYSYQSKC